MTMGAGNVFQIICLELLRVWKRKSLTSILFSYQRKWSFVTKPLSHWQMSWQTLLILAVKARRVSLTVPLSILLDKQWEEERLRGRIDRIPQLTLALSGLCCPTFSNLALWTKTQNPQTHREKGFTGIYSALNPQLSHQVLPSFFGSMLKPNTGAMINSTRRRIHQPQSAQS